MKSEFQVFIEDIEKQVGIPLTIYDQFGKKIFGSARDTTETDFKTIYADTQKGFSLFRIKFENKGYILRMETVGLVANNYAFFIQELANRKTTKNAELTKPEFFLSLFYNKADVYQIESYKKIFSIPEDIKVCVMVIDCAENRTGEVIEIISNYTENELDIAVEINTHQVGYAKFFGEEEDEYRSHKEFADFLYQSILEESGMNTFITIGGVVDSLSKLHQSFSQATYVYCKKDAICLSGNVYTFKEYVLVKILEEMPSSKLSEYLNLLMDDSAKEIFEDQEMAQTADVFLENNLNVSETSRQLYLHRNTLTYRLDKIEKATGLDIRNFSDAVTFRLIKILLKQVAK